MKVPFADLAAQHQEIRKEIDRAIKNVLKNNDYILGEDVRLFEEEFASAQARPRFFWPWQAWI